MHEQLESKQRNFQLFTTCPQSKDVPLELYYNQVIEVARWAEEAGFEGILVYTDNGLLDNWAVAQVILEHTEQIAPLIAIQPIYMHPYMVAKRIATFAHLYGRKVYLNMLAGGFKNDLNALGDSTPHDDRYKRTTEYSLIIRGLLESQAAFSFEGDYYQIKNAKMTPNMPSDLLPGILISGSSEAGMQASRGIGASAIRYPKPVGQEQQMTEQVAPGVRLGIIAQETSREAWRQAHERFPETREGHVAHKLAMKVSDSQWHHELSDLSQKPVSEENPYWMGPFQNYQTFCPYLVGSYEKVALELRRYYDLGFDIFITDIPSSKEELLDIQKVYQLAINESLVAC